jgi:hypothetical protein
MNRIGIMELLWRFALSRFVRKLQRTNSASANTYSKELANCAFKMKLGKNRWILVVQGK